MLTFFTSSWIWPSTSVSIGCTLFSLLSAKTEGTRLGCKGSSLVTRVTFDRGTDQTLKKNTKLKTEAKSWLICVMKHVNHYSSVTQSVTGLTDDKKFPRPWDKRQNTEAVQKRLLPLSSWKFSSSHCTLIHTQTRPHLWSSAKEMTHNNKL